MSDARINDVDAKDDEKEVNSVELREERKVVRSCVVIRTRRPFRGDCWANLIANVTSSAGVWDVTRRGWEEGDKSEGKFKRQGKKKDVGGVMQPFQGS